MAKENKQGFNIVKINVSPRRIKQCATCKFYGAPAYRGSVCIGRVCKIKGEVRVKDATCEQWEVFDDVQK